MTTATALAPDLRLAVGRLARKIRQAESAGLTPSQLSALASIDQLGPTRLCDLAAAEGVAAPTATRMVDNLERAGLVARTADPDDRRASRITLTAGGRTAIKRIRRQRTAFLQRQLDRLTTDELATLEAAIPILARLAEDQA